jgi:hypothetical protein
MGYYNSKQKGKCNDKTSTKTVNKRREEERDMRRTASQDVQEHCGGDLNPMSNNTG